ncbi:MAG: SDR family oxidoreductase [Deltaproteobacteria bacterium]|nr:SDR family oxidoreductase [Deltaproteobacteria bacterium]
MDRYASFCSLATNMVFMGKVAVVTGGGTGIGKAISMTLAKNGARVAIASRDPSHLATAAEEFKALGHPLLPIQMDVRKKEHVQGAVSKVLQAWGSIDILVNNAGLSGLTRIDDQDDSRWYDIVETNLTGMYVVTKEVLKVMKDHSDGRIINISSVLGKFGVPGYSAYCASKHGVIGFTKALALEVAARGITVNAICPGWVDTEMARLGMREGAAYQGISVEKFKIQAMEAVPLKRLIDAEEVAHLVLYLTSDKASGITGQAINICGGQTMV